MIYREKLDSSTTERRYVALHVVALLIAVAVLPHYPFALQVRSAEVQDDIWSEDLELGHCKEWWASHSVWNRSPPGAHLILCRNAHSSQRPASTWSVLTLPAGTAAPGAPASV